MRCHTYPIGATDSDGADEPHCESHREVRGHTAHTMSHGLVRLHDRDGYYVDSFGDLIEARGYILETEEV